MTVQSSSIYACHLKLHHDSFNWEFIFWNLNIFKPWKCIQMSLTIITSTHNNDCGCYGSEAEGMKFISQQRLGPSDYFLLTKLISEWKNHSLWVYLSKRPKHRRKCQKAAFEDYRCDVFDNFLLSFACCCQAKDLWSWYWCCVY